MTAAEPGPLGELGDEAEGATPPPVVDYALTPEEVDAMVALMGPYDDHLHCWLTQERTPIYQRMVLSHEWLT